MSLVALVHLALGRQAKATQQLCHPRVSTSKASRTARSRRGVNIAEFTPASSLAQASSPRLPFFQRSPRSFNEPWPSEEHGEQDKRLRALFEQIQAKKGCTVKDFQRMAKEKLGIELEGGDTDFTLASLLQKKRQGEMNAQVGA